MRQGQRWGECFGVTRLFFYFENNPVFPCWYSHTDTPTAFSPLTEYLDKGDKSFRSELASGKRRPGTRACARKQGCWRGGGE